MSCRGAPGVHEHVGGAGVGHDAEQGGSAPGDVVDDLTAPAATAASATAALAVSIAQGDPGAGEPLEDRQHAVELLVLRDGIGAGSRGLAPDVEQVRPLRDEVAGVGDRRVRVPVGVERTAVGEGVRGDVDHAHDEGRCAGRQDPPGRGTSGARPPQAAMASAAARRRARPPRRPSSGRPRGRGPRRSSWRASGRPAARWPRPRRPRGGAACSGSSRPLSTSRTWRRGPGRPPRCGSPRPRAVTSFHGRGGGPSSRRRCPNRSALGPPAGRVDQRHRLGAGGGIVAHDAAHRARHGHRAGLAHPAHGHAEVLGLDRRR
jgi:hypothetical protein